MIAIPVALKIKFEDRLTEKAIPKKSHGFYTKWLRYYLDFCHKYQFPYAKKESLAPFLRKLHEKKQTKTQKQQASDAVAVYYGLIQEKHLPSKPSADTKSIGNGRVAFKETRQFHGKKAPSQNFFSQSASFPGATSVSESSRQKKPAPERRLVLPKAE